MIRMLAVALCTAVALPAVFVHPAAAQQGTALIPHRAIYDLELVSSEGARAVDAARGRIAYEIGGGACEPYTVAFRQVVQMTQGGTVRMTDLRATNIEGVDGKSFRFVMERSNDGTPGPTLEGKAEHQGQGITLKMQKPDAKELKFPAEIVFPADHTRRLIEAAIKGETVVELPFYDGSESGEKIYDTTTIIGKPVDPAKPDGLEESMVKSGMDKVRRWPMTISYFNRADASGDRTPVYILSLELLENGVSRALRLDYGHLKLKGDLKRFDLGTAPKC